MIHNGFQTGDTPDNNIWVDSITSFGGTGTKISNNNNLKSNIIMNGLVVVGGSGGSMQLQYKNSEASKYFTCYGTVSNITAIKIS
jgi:hypothetical protein